ncbi:MAG: hypothetical protein QXI19_02160 [Candidatus Caldarchaeum sp.]
MTFIIATILLYFIAVVGVALAETRQSHKDKEEEQLPHRISYQDVQSGKVHIDWKKVKAG